MGMKKAILEGHHALRWALDSIICGYITDCHFLAVIQGPVNCHRTVPSKSFFVVRG
jgi:hypothetical protein